ncbi:hypothetical protein QTL86_13265 [Cellulosilyticum sp. ST5]|uniref:hypothetical protein n=1 Tax=Cellulosilyticum sp. ST5 TaxID=3055805 RepID=UPI0039777C4F
MKRFIVKVYEMGQNIEKKLQSVGEVETVSRVFKIYLVTTSEKNKNKIEDMDEVISIREEEKAALMPVV